jgi:branched-chain amino acid aminotransferase
MQSEYILLNGKYYLTGEKVLSHRNRGFCYGDALFETIHCLGTQPQFFDLHWKRLTKGMQILKMLPGEELKADIIQKHIEKLLNRNRIFKGARVRLTVFRESEGLYGPDTDTTSWLIETTVLRHEKYELNQKGFVISVYDEVLKPVNILSNLKTSNTLGFILAAKFRSENGFDECLLLNQYGHIAESIGSNVFVTFGNNIITPPLSEGCIEGIMRQTILKIAEEIGYKLFEKPMFERDIMEAEEVFLTNAIKGINWVLAYKDRRYFNFIARKLSLKLNILGFSP